ncbi:hypothetical protein [Flavobacterium sp. Root420]|uniref:hypothetical protein n=1 Tax=Flavobacterium sp. Root420 TaxID=1736533 RepID=UPI0006F82050|nr:hypothetical protein [Flavobacterium sp. Root420]KQX15311.1 hypothetical protein ASC72_00060 [Flavobacterium sp. Root420]
MSIPEELYNAKFAEFMESIKILYLIDVKFKMMCDDYCHSKIKTEKLKKKFEKSFNQKLKSENLSKELEEEILFYLLKKV